MWQEQPSWVEVGLNLVVSSAPPELDRPAGLTIRSCVLSRERLGRTLSQQQARLRIAGNSLLLIV